MRDAQRLAALVGKTVRVIDERYVGVARLFVTGTLAAKQGQIHNKGGKFRPMFTYYTVTGPLLVEGCAEPLFEQTEYHFDPFKPDSPDIPEIDATTTPITITIYKRETYEEPQHSATARPAKALARSARSTRRPARLPSR